MRKIIITLANVLFGSKNKRIDYSKINKIALIKAGAIGDVLMTTPLIRSIRETFPNVTLDYYTSTWSAKVLEGNLKLDNLFILNNDIFYSKKIFKILKIAKKIRKKKYDVIFVLDKSYLAGLFSWLCEVPTRIGFDRHKEGFSLTHKVKYDNLKHEVDYYLELGKFIECKPTNKRLELPISKKNKKYALNFLKKIKFKKNNTIAVAPGGGKNPGELDDIRRMPINKYIKLCEELIKKYSIILIGGPSDKEVCKQILHNIHNKKIIDTSGKTTIKQAGAIMSNCKLTICNDSGLMHVAGATSTKVISIFGPTNPARKAPFGNSNISIWKDQEIYEKDYELYGKKPAKERKFFQTISVNDIITKI